MGGWRAILNARDAIYLIRTDCPKADMYSRNLIRGLFFGQSKILLVLIFRFLRGSSAGTMMKRGQSDFAIRNERAGQRGNKRGFGSGLRWD
jgi:hypothetical protein